MQLLGDGHYEKAISKIRFHPKNQQLITIAAKEDEAIVWGWNLRGEMKRLLQLGTGEKEGKSICDIAFHPNGRWVALIGKNRPIEFYNLACGSLEATVGSASGYRSIMFTQNGRLMTATSIAEQETETYQTDTLHLLGTHPAGKCTLLQPHSEGEVIAECHSDRDMSVIHFHRYTDHGFQAYKNTLTVDFPVAGMAFSPNGRTMAIIGGVPPMSVMVVDFPTLKKRFRTDYKLPEGVDIPWSYPDGTPFAERMVFSPDSDTLVVPYPTGHIFELSSKTGQERRRWHTHKNIITSLDVHYRRSLITSCGLDGHVKIWRFAHEGRLPSIRGRQMTRAFIEHAEENSLLEPWLYNEMVTSV